MSEGEDDGYLACIEDIKKCKPDIVEGEKFLSLLILNCSQKTWNYEELLTKVY